MNVFLMQWDGNLTREGRYLDALALPNPWIQLGVLSVLLLCSLHAEVLTSWWYYFIFISRQPFKITFTGWPYLLQI